MRKDKRRKKSKVCFAETGLETVHEVPYSDIYSRKDFHCLKLPDINIHKYAPLAFRDPYARPSRKKKQSLSDLLKNETLKLPLIGLECRTAAVDNGGQDKNATRDKPKLHVPRYAPVTKATRDDKFQVGNTLHFKYSDFVLRRKTLLDEGQ